MTMTKGGHVKKWLIAGAAALVLGGAAGTVAVAQEAPPTVKVGLANARVTLEGAEALKAGPTRFEFSRVDGKEQYGELFAFAPGKTVEQFQEALPKGPGAVLQLGSLEAGVALSGKDGKRAVTVTLKPGVTYAMVQVTAEDPAKWKYTLFTVGQETSTAVGPVPDATVKLVDFAIRGSKQLPRNGVVRFENRGKQPHFTVAFPLRKGVNAKAAVRAVKNNRQRQFERMIAGAPFDPQGLITGGAVNDVEVKFAKRGKYVLACFFSAGPKAKPHSSRGMVAAVTVK
jgi:hypothetical protein